jgi:hypothetical protein
VHPPATVPGVGVGFGVGVGDGDGEGDGDGDGDGEGDGDGDGEGDGDGDGDGDGREGGTVRLTSTFRGWPAVMPETPRNTVVSIFPP